MNKRISVVATSIYDGDFLTHYCKKMTEEGVSEQARLIVIPDRKTPTDLYQKSQVLRGLGYNIVCPTIEEQDNYLKKLGNIASIIPYDSDSRRNIGFLMAYELGDEIIISIDDDNYPREGRPFFKEHKIVGKGIKNTKVTKSSNGWFNICDLLEFNKDKRNIYARGFPYYARFDGEKASHDESIDTEVHINAGLWLNSPDVDAITWLGLQPHATSFKDKSVVLGTDTWTPINTQNTSLNREVIPSYWFVKMGYPISGMSIDRYGDIFSGFFAQKCVKHLGYSVRVGTPEVDHLRNTHNAIKDLNYEFLCVIVLEDIVKWLTEVKLTGSTYAEAYLSLASQMEDAVQKFDGFIWNAATKGYFHHLAYCMRVWVDTINIISGAARPGANRVKNGPLKTINYLTK